MDGRIFRLVVLRATAKREFTAVYLRHLVCNCAITVLMTKVRKTTQLSFLLNQPSTSSSSFYYLEELAAINLMINDVVNRVQIGYFALLLQFWEADCDGA